MAIDQNIKVTVFSLFVMIILTWTESCHIILNMLHYYNINADTKVHVSY